jgi:serine/alanine adding enzyme
MKVDIHGPGTLPVRQWERYVSDHPRANLYHRHGWGTVIRNTYGHRPFFLICRGAEGNPAGILPLVRIDSLLFGKRLVSIPFFDIGGILADSPAAESALFEAARNLGRKFRVSRVEIRQASALSAFEDRSGANAPESRNRKVRMLLSLPSSPEELMAGFKSKLRSQIRKPAKEGLWARVGSLELMDDFYAVFVRNMRDLGSPVHSRRLVENVVREFPDRTRIVMVYDRDGSPAACGLVVGFRDVLANPWASALREYSAKSPNMLLYWTMLSHACERGYRVFDFGRSTPGEGTYRFKKQWGAEPVPVHWYSLRLRGVSGTEDPQGGYDSGRFDRIIELWKRMPVSWSRRLGPAIRRGIDL